MDRPGTTLFASFAFPDGAAMIRAMAALQGTPGLGEVFAFDEGVHQNLAATGFTVLETVGIASDLIGTTGSWSDRLGGLLRTARVGRALLNEIPWSLHVSIDGTQTQAEEARAEAAQRVAAFDGEAIPDVIPRVTRAKPFRPIKALVTPLGERWLPAHGLVKAQEAAPLLAALQSVLETSAGDREPHHMRAGFLVALLGSRITIEPQLYWPDALSAYTREPWRSPIRPGALVGRRRMSRAGTLPIGCAASSFPRWTRPVPVIFKSAAPVRRVPACRRMRRRHGLR